MAEIDKGFRDYAAKWKRRTGLNDRHIAEGYMRGQGGPEHMSPDDLPRISGQTDVHILLDGANLSASLEPADINEMITEWQSEVDCHKGVDPRAFTRRYLYESMVLNIHRDEERSTSIILAALWLMATAQDGEASRALLTRGDCVLTVEISVVDEADKTYRVRYGVGDYRGA